MALLITILICSTLTFGLKVEYDGVILGNIKDETVYDTAEKGLMQRVLFEEDDEVEIIPKFSLAVVNEESLLTSDEITDKLIEAIQSGKYKYIR